MILHMQAYVLLVLLFSGAMTAGFEKALNVTGFIADIYQQFPRRCIFLINPEAQQKGFEATTLIQQVRKYILYEYVPVVDMTSESRAREMCFTQRAIYVILKGNEETRSYINQSFLDTYSSGAIWLLFLDTDTSLEQFFTDINIPFDCQFLVAQPQSDHVVVLTEVYRVGPTLPLQKYSFGNWTAGGGLPWPSEGLYRRRNDLHGHALQVTHMNDTEDASNKNSVKENPPLDAEDVFVEIWATLVEILNVTNVFLEADSYGSFSANGTWTGMVALVSSGLADIGIGDFTVSPKRSEVVAFVDTVEMSRIKVFIRLPSRSDMTWNAYVAPFSYGLWLAVAMAACALSVCLALTSISQETNQRLTLIAVFFYVPACFCQQGQRDGIISTSGRIVIITTYVTSLVLMAGYSASLISSLAVQPRHLPFRDLQGLVHDGSYKLGVLQNSSHLNIFDRATDGIEKAAYERLITPFKDNLPLSTSDGFRRVCDEHNYAFIDSDFDEKVTSSAVSCQLVPLPGTSYPEHLSYIISKKNCFKRLINWRLSQFRETGIQARIRQQYITSAQPDTQPSSVVVTLETVAAILVLLAAGNISSLLVLVIERCVHGEMCKI